MKKLGKLWLPLLSLQLSCFFESVHIFKAHCKEMIQKLFLKVRILSHCISSCREPMWSQTSMS